MSRVTLQTVTVLPPEHCHLEEADPATWSWPDIPNRPSPPQITTAAAQPLPLPSLLLTLQEVSVQKHFITMLITGSS